MKIKILHLLVGVSLSLSLQASEKDQALEAVQDLYKKAIEAGVSSNIMETCPASWISNDENKPFVPYYDPGMMRCASFMLENDTEMSEATMPDYKKQIETLRFALKYFDNIEANCGLLTGTEKNGCLIGHDYALLAERDINNSYSGANGYLR